MCQPAFSSHGMLLRGAVARKRGRKKRDLFKLPRAGFTFKIDADKQQRPF